MSSESWLSFSRESLDALDTKKRIFKLQELRLRLLLELEHMSSHKQFFETALRLIEALKEVGHDLWNWDYDGESVEEWGGDYMNPTKAGNLYIEFRFPERVVVKWIDWKCYDSMGGEAADEHE